jgi:hypothetical protein
MLCELEHNETEGDVSMTDRSCLENWPRQGLPFRNVVAEYLASARAAGPDVEAGFCAVVSDFLSLVSSGSVPDAGFYEKLYNLEES